MLTAALDGLVDRFGLEGERLGEVAGGAVLKHSRDRDLTRESVLGTRLAAETPAYDVQQACGTGLETTILVANKIALGQIDAGIACGVDTTSDAPIALNEGLRETLLEANRQRSTAGKLRALTGIRPGHVVPAIPRNEEPRTGLSMGEHCAIMAEEWEIGRAEQDELAVASHRNLAAAYERGFLDDLITPYLGLERDQNLRPDSDPEKLAKLKPVFGGEEGTMTAANSTPLSDGASAVLLACEEWAKERGLPVLAYVTEAQTAAVDHVHKREGLLMAPAYAMPRMLDAGRARARRLRLLRDPRGLRRPGALHADGLGGRRRSARRSSASTARSARSTAPSSTSTAAASPPATRSPRPAGGSSPASPSSSTRTARAAA